MARLSDEQRDMLKSCRDKKNVAASSRRRRSHCGKSGSVKFPSDYMSKKELKSMHGEVKTYNIKKRITHDEFNELPADIQAIYLKYHREDEQKFKED